MRIEDTERNDDDESGGAEIDPFAPGDLCGWRLVRIGLRLTQIGISTMFLTVIPAVLLAVEVLSNKHLENPVTVVVLLLFLGAFLTAICTFCCGRCLCCFAPVESSARGHAIRSTVCMFSLPIVVSAWLLLLLVPRAGLHRFEPTPRDGRDMLLFMAAMAVLTLHSVGHVSFILFIRAAARYFNKASLATSTTRYLVAFGFVAAGLTAVVCVFFRPGTLLANEIAVGLTVVVSIGGVIAFAQYLLMIDEMHDGMKVAPRRVGT